MLKQLFDRETRRHEALAVAQVVPLSIRCVQCGICSYNCPAGIDIRSYSQAGQPVSSGHCMTCGECVARCPRGALSFVRSPIFS